MGTLIVFAEHNGKDFKRGAYELLTAAQKSGHTIKALVVGPQAESFAGKLGAWGAKEVLFCGDNALKNYNAELFSHLFCETFKNEKPDYVLASASALSRDLLRREAQKLGVG